MPVAPGAEMTPDRGPIAAERIRNRTIRVSQGPEQQGHTLTLFGPFEFEFSARPGHGAIVWPGGVRRI